MEEEEKRIKKEKSRTESRPQQPKTLPAVRSTVPLPPVRPWQSRIPDPIPFWSPPPDRRKPTPPPEPNAAGLRDLRLPDYLDPRPAGHPPLRRGSQATQPPWLLGRCAYLHLIQEMLICWVKATVASSSVMRPLAEALVLVRAMRLLMLRMPVAPQGE